MLKLKALDHVGLVVADMDRSLRFYCEALGLELLRRSDREGGVTAAVLKVGDQEINMFCNAGSAPAAKATARTSSAISASRSSVRRSTMSWRP